MCCACCPDRVSKNFPKKPASGGMPASETDFPDPTDRLLHNTDDTENLRQIVVVAINQAIAGGYHYLGETWNHTGEAMMYGRCLKILFELEQPIADIQPYLAEANVAAMAKKRSEEVKETLKFLATGKRVMEAVAAIRAKAAKPASIDADKALAEMK